MDNEMDAEELRGEIHSIFNPDPIVGSEGIEYYETPPLDRLRIEYGLDCSYWRQFEYGSSSELMHRSKVDDVDLGITVRCQQVPFELFMGTLRLLGDSILEYHNTKDRKGPYRFYPAILMSAWASFEAFVRIYSEIFIKTALPLPAALQSALLEREEQLDKKGNVQIGRKPRHLFERYWLLLKYGYGIEFDRGSRVWQLGGIRAEKEKCAGALRHCRSSLGYGHGTLATFGGNPPALDRPFSPTRQKRDAGPIRTIWDALFAAFTDRRI